MTRPFVLGLTGSIGMGKSAVAEMFRAENVPVFDADAEVHRLQGPGGALIPAIEAAFPGTTGPAGLDRAALGRIVFGDDAALARAALARLEAIVHPAVATARRAFLAANAAAPLVVFDIPLLFETARTGEVDAVAVVTTAPEIQRVRVLARPGMDEARLAAILARQTPDAEKRRRADFLLDTGVSLARTAAQVRALIFRLSLRHPLASRAGEADIAPDA